MKNKYKYAKLIACNLFTLFNIWGVVVAQTTFDVAVSNNKFEPANLNIMPGDIVKWTNNEGTHNVNGTTTSFPTNPASFGNDAGGPGWTYSFTFNIEGVYNYMCSIHGASMSGKITVGNATGIEDNKLVAQNEAFPNPAGHILNIPLSQNQIPELANLNLNIYNLSGQRINRKVSIPDKTLQVNIEELVGGLYFYELLSDDKLISTGKFVKLSN